MGINYGQLMAMLAGTAGLAAIGGHMRANKLNDYEDTMNSALPTGYKIPTKKRNFYFGSLDAQQKADDELYKTQQDKYRGDQVIGDVEQHPDVYYPTQPQSAPAQPLQIASPQPAPQQLPKLDYGQTPQLDPATPPSQGDPQTPTFSTGAVQPSLGYHMPRGLGLEGAKALVGLSQKGSEMGIQASHLPIAQQTANAATQNADTNSARQKMEARKAELAMQKTTAEISNIQQIMKLRPAESRAKIAKLAQKTGHSPNAIEMMLASGKSPKEIGAALYQNALHPDTESDSTTTAANGDVSHTHTVRGRSGSSASAGSPGHTVDVGGGVQIRGF